MIGGGDRLELSHRSPLGDRHSSALTGCDGTIDWWAPVGIDQPATFFALIDPGRGGALGIAIESGVTQPPAIGQQRFPSNAPVVDTFITGTESLIRIRDVIVDGVLYREVTALRGPVRIELSVVPGHRFGPARKHSTLGDGFSFGPTSVRGLATDQPARLDTGERLLLSVSPTGRDMRITLDSFDKRLQTLDRTWRSELECNYDGRFRYEVRAALQQLLLLTSPTNGALLRSFTTSLPARTGHERQIDSRMCWIDDGARFVDICERLERFDHAHPTRSWLAAAIDDPTIGAALTPNGDPVAPVIDLGLPGWRGHQPVVSGHRGAGVVDIAALAATSLVLDARQHRRTLTKVAHFLEAHAEQPDGGRWGGLGHKHRYVSAAIAARGALNAAAKTERRFDPLSEDAAKWQAAGKRLDAWLATEGCFGIAGRKGWRRTNEDDTSDAQLLRWIVQVSGRPGHLHVEFPGLVDDESAESRQRSEIAISQTLAQLNDAGLLHRHLNYVDDGFAPGQPCDTAASFEMVTVLAGLGRWEEANERMERAIGSTCGTSSAPTGPNGDRRSDTLAFGAPSFIDAQSGLHRGDRPSAPALISLIEAAIALDSGPV